ncbi:uncharacterized protein LOC127150472 isoform X2 [Cucumis melo]|uniref:Uncharacterized protein LOC127150472 isoform X2 n=1 Tax=Cucumis melo TaxID=3656 RepID=A0ABM3L2G8_CUCME|nr:uncharacterized protein LOC127150472 isoform X2 [Cucumis melo]
MPSNTYTRIQIHLGQTNTQYILFSLLKRICKKHGVKVDKEFVEVLAFRWISELISLMHIYLLCKRFLIKMILSVALGKMCCPILCGANWFCKNPLEQ